MPNITNVKPHRDISSHPSEWLSSINQQVLLNVWRKGNPNALLVGMQIGALTVESSMEIPQKIKNKTTCIYMTLLGILLKKLKALIWEDIYLPMFTATLFTIAKVWKQHKCPSIDNWIKMWCICTMEYYLKIKRMKSHNLQQHRWT